MKAKFKAYSEYEHSSDMLGSHILQAKMAPSELNNLIKLKTGACLGEVVYNGDGFLESFRRNKIHGKKKNRSRQLENEHDSKPGCKISRGIKTIGSI